MGISSINDGVKGQIINLGARTRTSGKLINKLAEASGRGLGEGVVTIGCLGTLHVTDTWLANSDASTPKFCLRLSAPALRPNPI